MKVKVCSVDELPSCTKLSDDLFENEDEWYYQQSDSGNRMNEVYGHSKEVGEDEWYNGKECDEAMNYGTLQEETLSDLIVQSSADDQQDYTGSISNEAYGCSQVVGEDCTEQFGFIESPV
ncbi:hypothetical protein L3X38_021574 [Prunus dulcis]|uniref:Uncharacterized protein n=1 Tax=Prunus dulcis TaxID=3755 RepID=A0AAD4Z4C7_PRUDU|nr:hypothetical protein L3X38_021574 [Prunus dulcis]